MFDSIRSHRRWLMFFMLVLIFPSFVFFGIQGYNSFVSGEGALATVDGVPITQQEFDFAQRERVERLRQQFGPEFDPKMLDTQDGRAAILDGLIIDRALSREVERGNLIVTNDQLRRVIANVPAFQEDNKFSLERYRAYVAAQGLSEQQFEERVRADLRKQMLVQAVLDSAIVPTQVAERIDRVLLEQREVRILPLRAEQYLSKVSVTDAQVSAFYDSHKSNFETPENVKVEYLVLSADSLAAQAAVSDADIKAFYEQNKGRYGIRGAAAREPHPDRGRGRRQGRGAQEGGRHLDRAEGESGRFRKDREGAVQGPGVRGARGRPGFLRQGHDGQAVRGRRVQAEGR